ncbi:MAG: imidazole glycerol phosphate synthase subunit HisH [Oscillospiraceae bacterium]|nr:imidazole glycerol phosphate synthase subunit HisH [Oscillospiraceae bacterium]
MIAIVDYGVGNLFSLEQSFRAIGAEVTVTADPVVLEQADKILLPGVGAFGDAAEKLRQSGLDKVVVALAKSGKPLLGICLGMQLLFDEGYEYGCHKGLGLIPGQVRPIADVIDRELKIPHMGWNALQFTRDSKLFANIQDGDFVYFVHSYYATGCEADTIATAEYGASLTAAVEKGNVFGCQFHPEKSGTVGLKILRAFSEMKV